MDLQVNRSFTKSDLECMLLDEFAKPKALPFSLLEKITNNFSYKQEIGKGGFAVVYMGILENRAVAVKRLSNTYKYESEFLREVECLMKVNHKNIVRFLGYCSDTQGHVSSFNGKFVMVDLQEKLLCFEYLPRGSLDTYIKDVSARIEWKVLYGIIKGICEGLHYLHSINIMHLDLKPSNILMDDNMIPKIADFGLSRSLEEMQTRVIATNMFGTIGYLAPEFTSHVVTRKFDMYSLGVIIMEILTGEKACQDVETVLEIWDSRSKLLQENPNYEQLRVCAEIGIECTNFDPTKRPVSMTYILDRLAEAEKRVDFSNKKKEKTEIFLVEYSRRLLKVKSSELRFPFKPNKPVTCELSLTNITDERVAFILQKKMGGGAWLGDASRKLLLYGIVPPMSTYTLLVTTAKDMKELPAELEIDLILHGSVVDEDTDPFKEDWVCARKFEQEGDALNRVTLKAVCELQKETTSKIIPHIEFTTPTILRCVEAHPIEPWIIMGDHCGQVHIWNYDTQDWTNNVINWQSIGRSVKISATLVWSIKIVARKQWILAGDFDGYIHVYHYGAEAQKIRSFKGASSLYVASLAIHPTKPYVLSATYQYIDLWDWENNWKCIHTFEGHSNTVHQLAFNPMDHDSFVSASWDNTVKVWNLNSPESSYTLSGHSGKVICLDFFTHDDQLYLITASSDRTAKIWDMQEKTCIHTIECFTSPFTCVISLPDRPYLVTGSKDGLIRLWNSSDYRLERIFDMGMLQSRHTTEVGALVYPTVSDRLMVLRDNGVVVLDVGDYKPVVTQRDNENSI